MVTSPHTRTPAQTAARYRAQISGLRRWSRYVLILGSVVSLACALGPLWLVRLGLIPALGAAWLSCLLAWREIGLERRAHAAALLAISRRHGDHLAEERRHNAAVVDLLSQRLHASHTLAGSRAATISRLHGDIRRLQGDVAGLRGANSRLTRDLNFRDRTIADLRETVRSVEAELSATNHDEAAGDVCALPRRPLREAAEIDSAERRSIEFLAAQAVITLPNYEDDRRFA